MTKSLPVSQSDVKSGAGRVQNGIPVLVAMGSIFMGFGVGTRFTIGDRITKILRLDEFARKLKIPVGIVNLVVAGIGIMSMIALGLWAWNMGFIGRIIGAAILGFAIGIAVQFAITTLLEVL